MSKIINFETMQIIVEKSLRDNGFGGKKVITDINGSSQEIDYDEGWKNSIPGPGGNSFNNPQNMQKLRDSIAQAITQALAASSASGSITQGNTIQTNQVVTEVPDNIILNGDAVSKGAARVDDDIVINAVSSPLFWAWATAVNTCAALPSPSPPQIATLTAAFVALQTQGIKGKIATGSSSVKIGD